MFLPAEVIYSSSVQNIHADEAETIAPRLFCSVGCLFDVDTKQGKALSFKADILVVAEIINAHDLVALLKKMAYSVVANKACCSGDEYFHDDEYARVCLPVRAVL